MSQAKWQKVIFYLVNTGIVFGAVFWSAERLDASFKLFFLYFSVFLLVSFLFFPQKRGFPPEGLPAGRSLAAFLLSGLASSVLSSDFYASFFGIGSEASLPWLAVLSLAGICCFSLFLFREKQDFFRLFSLNLLLLSLATVMAVVLIFGFSGPGNFFNNYFVSAIGGLESLALLLAGFNILFFSVFIRGQSLDRLLSRRVRPWMLFAFAASLILLVLINYAAAWLALIAGYLFAFFFFPSPEKAPMAKKRLWLVSMMAVPIIILFLGSVNSSEFSGERLRGSLVLDAGRTWQTALSSLKEDPVFGKGEGSFSLAYSSARTIDWNNFKDWPVLYAYPSSGFAGLLVSYGLAGALAFLVFLFFSFKAYFRGYKEALSLKDKDSELLTAVYSGWGALLTALSALLFFANLNIVLWFFLFLSAGQIIALSSLINPVKLSGREKPCFWGKRLSQRTFSAFLLALVLLMTVFSAQSAKLLAAYGYYFKSFKGSKAENLEKAVFLAPKNPQYRLRLALAYGKAAREEAEKAGEDAASLGSLKDNIDKALALAKQTAEEFPENPRPYSVLGNIYSDISLYSDDAVQHAVAAYREAGRLEPGNPVYPLEIAKLYALEKDYEEAAKYSQSARELKNSWTEADFLAAKIRIALNDYQSALAILEEIRPEDRNLEVYYELGRINFNLGNKGEAKENFKKVLEIEKMHANALYSLALIMEEEGDPVNALRYYKMVEANNPDNTDLKNRIKNLESEQ